MLTNSDIADVLGDIADRLEADDVAFKPRAYRDAAAAVADQHKDLTTLYEAGGVAALEALPHIGPNIAKKIVTLLEEGELPYYEKLKRKLPVDMRELTAVEGIGPKTVKALYHALNVKDLSDLEAALESGRLRDVKGFGQASEENLQRAIAAYREKRGRVPLAVARKAAARLVRALKQHRQVAAVSVAGSVRRRERTVGDIDLVAASREPRTVMEAFVGLPEVAQVYSTGPTKTLVRLKSGLDADLRVVSPESYGAALQYFTGNKQHSITTRQRAHQLGLKLNEYGLFKGTEQIAGRTEAGIYRALGLPAYKPTARPEGLPPV